MRRHHPRNRLLCHKPSPRLQPCLLRPSAETHATRPALAASLSPPSLLQLTQLCRTQLRARGRASRLELAARPLLARARSPAPPPTPPQAPCSGAAKTLYKYSCRAPLPAALPLVLLASSPPAPRAAAKPFENCRAPLPGALRSLLAASSPPRLRAYVSQRAARPPPAGSFASPAKSKKKTNQERAQLEPLEAAQAASTEVHARSSGLLFPSRGNSCRTPLASLGLVSACKPSHAAAQESAGKKRKRKNKKTRSSSLERLLQQPNTEVDAAAGCCVRGVASRCAARRAAAARRARAPGVCSPRGARACAVPVSASLAAPGPECGERGRLAWWRAGERAGRVWCLGRSEAR